MSALEIVKPLSPSSYQYEMVASLEDSGWWFSKDAKTIDGFGIETGEAWNAFADRWNHLLLDEYMRDGGTYRYRRYSAFGYDNDRRILTLLPHEAYEQSSAINKLNGGFKRRFEPLEPEFLDNPNLGIILRNFGEMFSRIARHPRWNIKLHPYRIVARSGVSGEPAPEGLHQDGVDFIVSYMIRRVNVTGGISTIADSERNVVGDVELGWPHDFVVGNDRNTYHGVSSVNVDDPKKPFSYRDVLVIAFEKA